MKRLLLPALLGLALYYILFGGEYSVFDVRGARMAQERAQSELDSLRRVNDSLAARADSLEHDLSLLERIAREQFGMIRDGEVLYRFTEGEVDTLDRGSGGR